MPVKVSSIFSLFVFMVLVMGGGALGGGWDTNPWYEQLIKPPYAPHGWLFPLIWTGLYILIALAGWLVWLAPLRTAKYALFFWVMQLLLNATWSHVFFIEHKIDKALIELAALGLFILAFTIAALRVDKRASLLFVPYLVWVCYAGLLNFAFWQLNG